MAAVVNRYEATNDQQSIHEKVNDLPYPNPVTIRKRSSLFEKCWSIQGSAFEVDESEAVRDVREYERETLDRIRELGSFLEERGEL